MKCKCYFWSKTQASKEISTFQSKSNWNPRPTEKKVSPELELFFSKTEQNLFSVFSGKAEQFNLVREEYLTMRDLPSDRNVIIKPADKAFAVLVWD